MARFFKDMKKAAGQIPGSLIFIGNQKMDIPRIHLMDFSQDHLDEAELDSIEQAIPYLKKPSITWINIDGLHHPDTIQKIGDLFNIHPIILEDIMNTDNRPKLDEDLQNIVLIMKIIEYNNITRKLQSEQFSLILGRNYLITLQEQQGIHFEIVIDRIRNNQGRIRTSGSDYLAYTLIDSLVDKYMIIVGEIGEQIENLEESILKKIEPEIAEEIFRHKTEIHYLRKSIRPVREIIAQLIKSDSPLISKRTYKFLLDLNELIIFINEIIDTYQLLISDQFNLYNSNITNRTNETVKILTVFTALFIPLTFIAGIYGMNFDFIPELHLRFGYLLFWLLILITAMSLLYYFRKKKWI